MPWILWSAFTVLLVRRWAGCASPEEIGFSPWCAVVLSRY